MNNNVRMIEINDQLSGSFIINTTFFNNDKEVEEYLISKIKEYFNSNND